MKRKRTRFAALMGLVAVVLLACWVGLLVYVRQTLPSPPLPNPNGYDDFIKAGLLTTTMDNFAELDRDQLRALVETNAEPLRLLRLGLTRQCSVPTDAAISNFASIGVELKGLMSLAKLATAEGKLAELEFRPVAAISYLDSIRLGMEISRGGFMIHRLVGIASETMGIKGLIKLLPTLSCTQIKQLSLDLEAIDNDAVTWGEVVKNEKGFERAQVASYRNPIAIIGDWWQSRGVIKNLKEKHILATARLRLLMTELALRSYRCNHEDAPMSLEHLVPVFLKKVPSDPFAKGSLAYRPAGTNWLLYSVGIDRIDDNGKPVIGKSNVSQKTPGDLLYDSQW